MKTFLYFLQFIIIKIIFTLLKVLPLNISKTLSSSIFRILGKLSGAHKTAIKNCKFVFPDFSDNQINNIINKSWNNIGKTICELSRLEEIINSKHIYTV